MIVKAAIILLYPKKGWIKWQASLPCPWETWRGSCTAGPSLLAAQTATLAPAESPSPCQRDSSETLQDCITDNCCYCVSSYIFHL